MLLDEMEEKDRKGILDFVAKEIWAKRMESWIFKKDGKRKVGLKFFSI